MIDQATNDHHFSPPGIYDAALLYEINNDTGGKKKKKRNKNRTNIGNLYARNPDGTFVK